MTATVPVKGAQAAELYRGVAAQQSQALAGGGGGGGTIVVTPWASAAVKEAIIGRQNKNRMYMI